MLGQEGEGHGGDDAKEGGDVVPSGHGLEIQHGKDGEDGEGDDFLDDFQLVGGEGVAAPAVGRDLQNVFEEGDAPTDEDDDQDGLILEFEMAVPSHGHEDVGAGQQDDGEPAGVVDGVHNILLVGFGVA